MYPYDGKKFKQFLNIEKKWYQVPWYLPDKFLFKIKVTEESEEKGR
jgi:hypothetical protein